MPSELKFLPLIAPAQPIDDGSVPSSCPRLLRDFWSLHLDDGANSPFIPELLPRSGRLCHGGPQSGLRRRAGDRSLQHVEDVLDGEGLAPQTTAPGIP